MALSIPVRQCARPPRPHSLAGAWSMPHREERSAVFPVAACTPVESRDVPLALPASQWLTLPYARSDTGEHHALGPLAGGALKGGDQRRSKMRR